MRIGTNGYQLIFMVLLAGLTYLASWVHVSIAHGRAATLVEAATEHNLARLGYAILIMFALNYLMTAWIRKRKQGPDTGDIDDTDRSIS